MSFFREHIAALEGYEPGEQPTDPAVIKLNTNENPYPPSPKVLEAVGAVTAEQLRRYPDPLGSQFREVAGQVFRVSPEQVLCGNGMDELLNMTVRAFSGPEAAMAYPVPTYTLYAVLARVQASIVREVPFPDDFSLPIDALVKARAQVTYLANPNSPTGTFVPVEQVAELADRLEGVLCVDEAYVDFASQDCLGLARTRRNVLVMRTMSKGYSLAGIRFGFAVGHRDLIAGLRKIKDSYNVDAVAIAAAAAALGDQPYRDRTRGQVIGERERLVQALAAVGMRCLPSEANFLLARVGRPGAPALYESLKARGILVRYFNSPRISDCLRITVGTPRQNDALIAALRELTA